MTTFNDPQEYQKFMVNNMDAIAKIARDEHNKMASDMEKGARTMVSGNIKSEELRKRGHPFSRKRFGGADKSAKAAMRKHKEGLMQTPLLPINVQSGKLRSSLKRKRIWYPRSLNAQMISFDAPYSIFVLGRKGTKKMIPRKFIQEFEKLFKKAERIMKQKFNYRVVQLRGQHIAGGKI